MSYQALNLMLDIRWHRHSSNSSNNQRKAWNPRNPVSMASNGGKEGYGGQSPVWVEAMLATKSPRSLASTSSYEGALGHGGKKAEVEDLWREFFLDPGEWRDHRSDKANPRFPDFKHRKHPEKALWLDSKCIPPWVEEKLVALPRGSTHSSAFSWNQQLRRCAQAGQHEKTIELFQQMQRDGEIPDRFTFAPVLEACSSLGLLEHGRRIHAMMEPGFQADLFIGTCLVDMYCKCGNVQEAEMVFNQMPTTNVVTFSAMIYGYVKCGEGQKALELFERMLGEGVDPNRVTFVGVVNACASVTTIEGGRRVHKEIICRGYESDVAVGNCLVDMYAKCGSIEEAERVFNKMPSRDVVTWTAMLAGYVKCGSLEEAESFFNQMPTKNVVTFNAMIGGYVKCGEGLKGLELFEQMLSHGLDPDRATLVGVLNACASVAAIEGGRRVHEEIIRRGYELDVIVGNCLVDMYSKCGSIEEAERVFDKMPTRDVVTWTTMLAGYGIHGYTRRALETFEEMCKVVKVNGVTFISLLSACSHGGLVPEGMEYFESMSTVYNITPTVEHYACVVDILGRAGRLHEAEDLIRSMPMGADATVWMALLSACRAHVDVDVGQRCVEHVLELEPDNAAAYVLLSNIYVAAGKLHSIARLSGERLDRGVKKIPACSWICVNDKVHSFGVDDHLHPRIVEIRAELDRLFSKMNDSGYLVESKSLACDNEEESRRHLCHHSEKLAIAFGHLSTDPGTPLIIRKNLRVCGDCHTATKFISKIVGRAITVKDANQFHHFQNGLCSCGDYF